MTPLVFAFGAGLLATVNPCGFAMLPAFLAYYLGDPEESTDGTAAGLIGRLAQGFGVGAAVSAGFTLVFVTAGLLVSAGLRSMVRYVPWAAIVIGAALALLGIALLAGRHVGLRATERLRPGEGRGYGRIVVFGAAYALASMSCTLAVLLAVVAQAVATDNPLQMLAVFLAYGAGAATVLTALSVSAALAKGAVSRLVRRVLPVAERAAGAVLVVSGLYLLAYWYPVAVGSGLPNRSLSDVSSELSSRLSTFLDAHQGAFVALAVLLLGVGLAVGIWVRARSWIEDEEDALDACCEEEVPPAEAPGVPMREKEPIA